jgi:hypothetical protein
MGILDRINIFKRRKKDTTDVSSLDLDTTSTSTTPTAPTYPGAPTAESVSSNAQKAQMDLVISQIDSLRIQYQAIDSRLNNIEKLVTEIRSFCR